jgi:hypothetical protein
MSESLRKQSFFERIRPALSFITAGMACIGAATGLIGYFGNQVFSLHDLKGSVASIDTKVDAIIAHNDKVDQDNAMYREYTDRRFNWLDERVTVVETRTATQPNAQQMPAPSDRYALPLRHH